ncbi:GNAT family N-acetyltransferase [Thalassotalea sediminis]|uniref:GNAT family N-acetyltransferase n=1 Tax=Thalassotalea sediminis TaxID=1759089 RepID=UPI002573CA65|nr:GNAT family N-acetyltransferase [Thalassotalea sediminis]
MTQHFTTKTNGYTLYLAQKSDKKAIMRFYKNQHYSASFMGYDHCYLLKDNNDDIIASVIVSTLTERNTQALLHALVVKADHQGLGLAKTLLEHCIRQHATIVCFAAPNLKTLYTKVGLSMLPDNQIEQHLNEVLSCRYRSYQKQQPLLNAFITC